MLMGSMPSATARMHAQVFRRTLCAATSVRSRRPMRKLSDGVDLAAKSASRVSHSVDSGPVVSHADVGDQSAEQVEAKAYVPDTPSPLTTLGPRDAEQISSALRRLYFSESARMQLFKSHGILKQEFVEAAVRLWRRLQENAHAVFCGHSDKAWVLAKAAAACRSSSSLTPFSDVALPYILDSVRGAGGASIAQGSSDLRRPETWYPAARSMRRRIIYHAGPTNSGKTYNALQALKNAWSGVYCGPLRLLALEVYESMNSDGTPCSLSTGQERRETPFSAHVSCTIEMMSTERFVDVAVIDEIQMIGDDTRGASWTRALLGVPAAEVHVCGDAAALPAVEAICASTGDSFEVRRYERMTAISPQAESLDGDYSRIEAGDAIVAFSRKDIFGIRHAVERKTAHKCCVVYGSLPPETRATQARLFNDPGSGFRVLVASDAIGMGLNLNIRRVVFHTLRKFDGVSTGPLSASATKQIAGRAGRRNSIYPEGFATTLVDEDLPEMVKALATPSTPITAAGLFPNPEQLVVYSALLPQRTPLTTVISEFMNSSKLEGPYFMCRSEELHRTAALLLRYENIAIETRAMLCLIPANLRKPEVRGLFYHFLDQYVDGEPVRLDMQLPIDDPEWYSNESETLEIKAQGLDVYLWLASKLGTGIFVDFDEASHKRAIVSRMLETALMRISEDAKDSAEAQAHERRRRRKERESFGYVNARHGVESAGGSAYTGRMSSGLSRASSSSISRKTTISS